MWKNSSSNYIWLSSKRTRLSVLCLLISCLLFPFASSSQETLTLQSVIESALKNNYSVQISRNTSAIAHNEATIGNAGMLPIVGINGGESFSVNNTQQSLSTGAEINRKGAKSTNASLGAALNWTLFDGMKMFVTYDKLKILDQAGGLQLKQQMETTVIGVITAYFEIIRQQQLLSVLDTTIEISKEQVKISESKWQIGSASKMEYLQSTVDLNEQKSLRLSQLLALENAKSALNVLLARGSETTFEVDKTIAFQDNLKLEDFKTSTQSGNTSLAYLQKNLLASELSIKEIKSGFYPKLIGNAGYSYSRATNQASIINLNQNLGLNAGLTFNWTVFDGMNLRRRIKSAQLSLASQKLQLEDTRVQTESAVVVAYRKYTYSLAILKLEEANHKVAEESAMVALERFRTGTSNILELKSVQKALLDAQTRLVNTRYNTKLAETELMRLNGTLVK